MSAILYLLLGGLGLLGGAMLDPAPVVEEDIDPNDSETQDVPDSEGNNPFDEAIALLEAEQVDDAPQSEDVTASDPVPVPDPEPDPAPEPAIGPDVDNIPTTGDDTITGSAADNFIDAGDGADHVMGGDGDDTLQGGAGADSVEGQAGNDVVYGGDQTGPDDGVSDTLSGGDGADQLFLGEADQASGGAGADTFTRLDTVTLRMLISDFDEAEDVIVVQHDGGAAPTLDNQRIVSDGLVLEFSDGTQIELNGQTAPIDPALVSYVDTSVV